MFKKIEFDPCCPEGKPSEEIILNDSITPLCDDTCIPSGEIHLVEIEPEFCPCPEENPYKPFDNCYTVETFIDDYGSYLEDLGNKKHILKEKCSFERSVWNEHRHFLLTDFPEQFVDIYARYG